MSETENRQQRSTEIVGTMGAWILLAMLVYFAIAGASSTGAAVLAIVCIAAGLYALIGKSRVATALNFPGRILVAYVTTAM